MSHHISASLNRNYFSKNVRKRAGGVTIAREHVGEVATRELAVTEIQRTDILRILGSYDAFDSAFVCGGI